MITFPSLNSSQDGTRDTAWECVGVASSEAARLRVMAAILLDISKASRSNLYCNLKLNYHFHKVSQFSASYNNDVKFVLLIND